MVEEMLTIVSQKAQDQRLEFQDEGFEQQILNYIDNFNQLIKFLLNINNYFTVIDNNNIQLEKTKQFINQVVNCRPTIQIAENATTYIPEGWAGKLQEEEKTYDQLCYYKPIFETADRKSYLESTQLETVNLIVKDNITQKEQTYTIPIQQWHKQFDKEIRVKSNLSSVILQRLFVATREELIQNLAKLADSPAIISSIIKFAGDNQLLWLQRELQ